MRKRIGVFIGTFNPIHNGHLMMVCHTLNYIGFMDKAIIVPSPKSFGKKDIIDLSHRVNMINLAITELNEFMEIRKKIVVSDIEKDLSGYTIDTLNKLQEIYPDNLLDLVIGADNLENLFKFKDAADIITRFNIIILGRNNNSGSELTQTVASGLSEIGLNLSYFHKFYILPSFPETDLSSTFIRNQVLSRKEIWAYVPKSVAAYIKYNQLYE